MYCRICQRCICAICVLEEHRTHQTVSVQTERLVKQVKPRALTKEVALRRGDASGQSRLSCGQKLVARTEQELVNRIKDKESRVGQLKKKMEAAKVRRWLAHLRTGVSADASSA